MEGAGSLKGEGLKGKIPNRVELGIRSRTEKVEDRSLQRGKDRDWGHHGPSNGGGCEAGLLTEDRGGGLKQVDIRGKAPCRDKWRKLAAEQGKDTRTLY